MTVPSSDSSGPSRKSRPDRPEEEIRLLREEVHRLREAVASLSGPMDAVLKRRGFRIYKKEYDKDVIRPEPGGKGRVDELYQALKKYSFRLFLRDAIKFQDGFTPEDLVRYSSLRVVGEYVSFLAGLGVLEKLPRGRYALKRRPVTSFGPTLEWFTAELLRREYAAEAAWGVKFRNTGAGGDYDLLALVEGRLLYAEIKSSPPKQVYDTEIRAYIDRFVELSPEMSLFVMDTELRMKDKIVAMFERVLPDTPLRGVPVGRHKAELFRVGDRIFIVNSKGGLEANIGEALGWFLRRGRT